MKNKTFKKLIAMLLVIAMIVPTFGIMYTSAATGDTVELAFNNLFVFEEWANNTLSTTVQGTAPGTLETDVDAGSFTLTKTDTTQGEVYTCFSMSTGDAAYNNFSYYMADVKPDTTYKFAYNLEGTVSVFTPFVFMFDGDGNFVNMATGQTTAKGANSFTFETGSDIAYIQVRFTINETASSVYATVSDIIISKIDTNYSSDNLFNFASWAGSSSSNLASAYAYDDGTITTNLTDESIYFTTNTASQTSGMLFTDFSFSSNSGYDAIDVEPNTTYTLFYTLSNDSTIGNFVPYIVRNDASGAFIDYIALDGATHYGESSSTFTTTADTEYVSVVFSITHNNQSWTSTVSKIGVYETTITDYAMDPHRLTYTEGAGTYGELPTPANVPSGMYFAGWFTGENGLGEAITADTEISYKSYTVYPYYQIAVDKLEIKTPPVKTTYTLGEKLNTTGLVLTGTVTDDAGNTSTFDISSGYICSPTVLTSSGTQPITVSYGGKTVTFNVDVSLFNEKTIPVNDTEVVAQVANNVYTINYTAPENFNRYEITYYSDAYVKGTITMADGTYEEFFLEPATNGSFASYVDDFLTGVTYADIQSIGFESLNKEFGTFELYSVETVYVIPPTDTMAYYENDRFKAGINLAWGGVLAYLQDLNQTNPVMSATYSDGITKVNYKDQLPAGATSTSTEVNLINTFDKGRYVQQSYYGTREEPYVLGNYNGVEWNYNPIQGGNILGEAAKVVDYRITDTEIYVKTRPLEWAKWSDEAGAAYNAIQPDDSLDKELIYEDSYNPWAYMESWYVFEDGIIKTYCRYVDYSGYPSATTTQEFPAFYCVEPLNNFVYYSGGEAWDTSNTATWESDLDFWGASPEYNQMLIANGLEAVDPHYNCNENWAAFMGGTTNEDFGIGIYTADVTDFVAGSFMSKYQENQTTLVPQETALRHADTLDPATENPTSYIAPINTMELESYREYTYAYYITTGTQEQIREDFRREVDEETAAKYDETKVAVPETVYMTPASSPDSTTTLGQYYVNNILDSSDYYNVTTVANATDGMYFGINSGDAVQYKISVTNATNPSDDIILGNADGTGNNEGTWYSIGSEGNDIQDNVFSLRFASTGLKPGETATAKWEITVEYEDGTTKTYNAYTVMYAPMTTVGAVAEARQTSTDMNEVSSWITGANGIDHSRTAPLGSFYGDYSNSGYFKYDPLAYPDVSVLTGVSTGATADDLINVATDSSGYYVQQTATNGADDSRSHSYLGLLAIDKSRYTNTNQIPNLKIGYDALRVGSNEEDSLDSYATYYTLGTAEAYTATDRGEAPSGWTTYTSYNELYSNNGGVIPYRETVVPSYAVSDGLDGQYIHAIVQGRAVQQAVVVLGSNYATAGTSVLLSVTDKSALRDAVTDGYTLPEENYNDDSYVKFEKELEEAATVLGDPSASQEEIDQAQKELEDAKDALVNPYYALKYDNLFSAYEFSQKLGSMTMNVTSNASISYNAGTLTVVSDNAEKTDIYAKEGNTSDYYNIDVKPSTEYVFEYDLTTTAGSQVLLFFYDANGNQVASTNQTSQINGGNASTITSSPHFASYVHSNGHVVLRFTTNANVDRIGFRFGNANNVVDTSTFSNIRLIEAEKYYADAQYSKTETVYAEYDTYGTLITPVRTGYTFTGWVYEDGTAATAADLATAHKSVYSTWNVNNYTITYDANGGSVSTGTATYNIENPATLVTPTRGDYIFAGWKVTSTDGNWTVGTVYQSGQVPADMYGNVTLTAVWTVEDVLVLFDTILDFNDWNTASANNATISNVTENAFTLTSNAGAGEGTSTSPYFPVTAGKQYYVDIDFEGDNWDVYIFFHNDTTDGLGIDFNDSTNRFSSNGSGNATRTFTAPAGATKAVIRLDANGSSNSVTFSDIRVYEVGTRESDVDVPFSSKDVKYNSTFGELPVPTKFGYTFKGWYDENGNQVTDTTKVTYQTPIIYLHSEWEMNPPFAYEDSVVIDYSLPVRINVCLNDQNLGAGSITAIGTELADGAQIGANAYTTSQLTDGVTSGLALSNGTAYIDGDTIVYTPSGTAMGKEVVFYYEYKADDGMYYYTTVTVIPATSIYYEESFMTFVDGDGYKWEDVGTTITGRFQENDANNPYGNDSAYDDSYTFSMGSAKVTTVDNASYGKEPVAKFTFSGTGFDFFSVTNSQTGAVLVTIYKAGTKTIAKNFLVSTYYGYTVDDEGSLLPDTESTDSVYQVPVISYRDLAPGSYDVVIKPLYSRAFDPNYVDGAEDSTNAYSLYVDSVRIFNPTASGEDVSDVVKDAYLADGEYAPVYKEIRDIIISAEDYYNDEIVGISQDYTGALFIDGNASNSFDGTGITTYNEQGPNNEVYLGKNQAIAFNVSTDDAQVLAGLQLGMKVVSGNTASVAVMNTNNTDNPTEIEISGAHEQFHRLDSDLFAWQQVTITENDVEKTVDQTTYPIVIVNTSDSVISLTSFKMTHTTDISDGGTPVVFNVNRSTGRMATTAVQEVMDNELKNYYRENISVDWSDDSFTVGKEATLTVTTPADIEVVTIDGIEITDCVIDENGNKIWTYTFVVQQSGESDYVILFYDENGLVDEVVKTETIVVEQAPADDVDTPDEPDADTTESIFDIIINFIKKILDFFGGVFG